MIRTAKVVVPVSTFIAGVILQLLADRIVSKFISDQTRIILAALGGLLIVVVILSIIITFDYVDRAHKLNHINETMEILARRFGLSVEFVPDHPGPDDGLTYERTRQLISHAQRSLVFVDLYIESGTNTRYRGGSSTRRRSYYNEIIRQIAKAGHPTESGPFHRRIIQADLEDSGGRLLLNEKDPYGLYMRQCLEQQQQHLTRESVTKLCQPGIYTHFVIIDGRYVILPILATGPGGVGLRRHGAFFFEDIVGDLVNTLMSIYEMLDARAHPLTSQYIEWLPQA